ncbi:MAG: hypothetical protein JJU11_04450 [Candidatus Sumerlaeia bacterium]|nr:hypothetical protein [Candidatus Sumerlaeia bacterium]
MILCIRMFHSTGRMAFATLALLLFLQTAGAYADDGVEESSPQPDPAAQQGFSAPWTPLQLAIMGGSKLFDRETPVYGLGLGLIGVDQGNMVGLSMAPAYSSTDDMTVGLQLSAGMNNVRSRARATAQVAPWNIAERRSNGMMLGVVNMGRREYTGLQLGALSNSARGNIAGLQIAGYSSTSEAKGNALQLAGFRSTTGSDFTGVQIAGSTARSDGAMGGIQLSGFSSFASDEATGCQLALIFNSTNHLRGLQLGGVYNNSNQLDGIQMTVGYNESGSARRTTSRGMMLAGLTNRSRTTLSGGQIALMNTASQLRGFQFGLVNRSTRMNGVQIGLINFHRGSLSMPLVNIRWSIDGDDEDGDE